MNIVLKQKSVLPGFGLTMGYTLFYLSLIVLIPLSTVLLRTLSMTWSDFWNAVASPRALASYRLTIGCAFIGALINSVFGLLVAWVLVRYKFPGKRIVDGLVDLPFALPTAVAGIALTAVYSENGIIGQYLKMIGIKSAYTPIGITIALTFIGLPFVVRTVQPIMQDLDIEQEEAAACLGASRLQTFRFIILPELITSLLTGFTLAFARALGEYGSVIFIAGNMPMKTEITSLLIMIKLEQFDYIGASALALVFMIVSFTLLFIINMLQHLRVSSASAK